MTPRRDWQTESVRFTFLGCPEAASDLITWSKITGREADSVTVKRAQGLRNEEGTWDGRHLSIAVAPGRIDVVLSPAPETMLSTPAVPSLGELSVVAQGLCDRLVALPLPQSARLAVGAKVNSLAADSADALALMKKYLPFLEVDESSTDVIFQHNSPKKIRQSGIELNRLYKWSQMAMHFIQIAAVQGAPVSPVTEVTHAVQLELDINTSPLSKLPATSAYGAIVKEMFAELVGALPGKG